MSVCGERQMRWPGLREDVGMGVGLDMARSLNRWMRRPNGG
jgi:hypothetical protein